MPLSEISENESSMSRRKQDRTNDVVKKEKVVVQPLLRNKRREKSQAPPMGALQLNLLKCQAAQAKMIIARNERKYQNYMDALNVVDDASRPPTKEELLAAELQELQRRKAALHSEASSSSLTKQEEEHDDENDEDEERIEEANNQPEEVLPEAVCVTPDGMPQWALPLRDRRPWDISIAEPIVMDALLRHQDRAYAKQRRDGFYAPSIDDKLRPAPPKPGAFDTFRQCQPSRIVENDGGALFVLTAVEHGLKGFAPYLFKIYGGETEKKETPAPQPDPYGASVDGRGDVDLWDPRADDDLNSLEAKLTEKPNQH